MSHIAAALAKSKGKHVTPPPTDSEPSTRPLDVTAPPLPATGRPTAPTSERPRGLLYASIAALVLIAAVTGFWLMRGKAPEPPAAAKPAATVATAPRPSAGAPAAVPAGQTANQAATVPAGPSEHFFATVRQFTLSAVMAGANPRAQIDGRLYQVGDKVAPGLVLSEVRDGQLIFRDDAGNEYPRRF